MILHYPSITKEEFKQGCHDFEQRYLQAQTQDLIKIRFDGECLYIRQRRPETRDSQDAAADNSSAELVEIDTVIRPSH